MIVRPPFRNDGGYIVEAAALFDGLSGYLSFNPASAGDNPKQFTLSLWAKRAKLASAQTFISAHASSLFNSNDFDDWYIDGSDQLRWITYFSAATQANVASDGLHREVDGWNHFVVVADFANATAEDRIKFYKTVSSWSIPLRRRPT